MRMARGLDTGDILGQIKVPIMPKDTTGTIGSKLCEMGKGLLIDVLRALDAGTLEGVPQPPDGATYASKVSNEETWLRWTLSAVENERIVRAFNPKPGAKTFVPGVSPGERGMLLKVMAADVEDLPRGMARALPGTLLEMHHKRGPLIAGGAGRALRLVEVQPEGRPHSIPGGAFANGYREKIPIGLRFLDKPPTSSGEEVAK
jgi:methionyl-tRNA formyltransferase